jgi:hypothetical protein
MKAPSTGRPSPSLVISILALVVALGGSAYAAINLPKNSVGAKQIKRNAVTRAKIKKNAINGAKVKRKSLTGADIDLEKLGTVPSAQTANSIPPAEASHLVGSPGEPPFQEGSTNLGPQSGINTAPAGFYKDHEGIVHLQGAVKVGGPNGIIFTLPAGYRPAGGGGVIFVAVCNPPAKCSAEGYTHVAAFGSNTALEGSPRSGQVRALATPEAEVSLDGITFRAES